MPHLSDEAQQRRMQILQCVCCPLVMAIVSCTPRWTCGWKRGEASSHKRAFRVSRRALPSFRQI